MARYLALLVFLLPGAPPNPPAITEPAVDGQIANPADVHMEAGSFSDPDSHAHASTAWSIWKVSTNQKVWDAPAATGPEAVHIHLGDGAFVGPYAGRSELEYDTDYRLEVRFRDSNDELSAVSSRLFRTSPAGPPGVAAPIPWIPFEHGYRVEVVAGDFQLPVNIAFHPGPNPAPTDPLFYVAELYGSIKVVRRNGAVSDYATGLLNYDPTALGTFPGAGEQGLAGLCIDPVSKDLFVTLLQENVAQTARWPRVVRLTSSADGLTATGSSVVLDMPNEPQGQSHQISHCSIGPDGKLYVHVGDGFDWTTAANLDSFRGKILRMNLNGTAPTDNPFYNASTINARDYVWVYGVRNPFGGGWRSDGEHYIVENGPARDRLGRAVAGRTFGWDNTNASMQNLALHVWNPARAPVTMAFVEPGTFFGSGFPGAKMGKAYITESGPTYASGPQANGKRIVEATIGAGDAAIAAPTTFVEYAGTGRATAVAIAAGPDGLYFSDLYRDQGAASPSAAGAQILRVRYAGVPPAGSGTGFRATYYDNPDFSGATVSRTDASIDFSWPAEPAAGIGPDDFSVRWTGRVEAPTTDTYTFYAQSAGGVRLWVDGTLVIDAWDYHASREDAGTIALQAGRRYAVVLEFRDDAGTAEMRLRWSSASNPKETVPSDRLYGPALAAGGGSGGGCGLLGYELLLLAALRRRRAPRRRAGT